MKDFKNRGQSVVCETLEPRLMLSGISAESTLPQISEQFDLQFGDSSAIQVSGDFEANALKSQQLTTYDAGDSYWCFDREIPLHRVVGLLVLNLADGLKSEDVLTPLMAEGSILSDYTITNDFGQGLIKMETKPEIADSASQISTETLKETLKNTSEIEVLPHF